MPVIIASRLSCKKTAWCHLLTINSTVTHDCTTARTYKLYGPPVFLIPIKCVVIRDVKRTLIMYMFFKQFYNISLYTSPSSFPRCCLIAGFPRPIPIYVLRPRFSRNRMKIFLKVGEPTVCHVGKENSSFHQGIFFFFLLFCWLDSFALSPVIQS